jgi:DNA-binding NarL/FixJ family response regulator
MNSNPYADLTVQERRVFDLLREGRSNKEIAEEFSVSVSTVKSHVNSIFSKLGIKSRREIMNM